MPCPPGRSPRCTSGRSRVGPARSGVAPNDGDCHRQEWSFTLEQAGKRVNSKEFQLLETPHYPGREIKPDGATPPASDRNVPFSGEA
jgi:hypothetical protein